MQKLFTKSAFKQALDCPTKAYYYRNPDVYANQELDDEFLESLAEGGFQVGEVAKVYQEVPEANEIKELDYDKSLAATKRLFDQENVKIAEAAFKFGNCFVRTDILVKRGHKIDVIEVKSHSWNPEADAFFGKRDPNKIERNILPYVYDVTFQKWVVMNALKEQYPGEEFTVKAWLMMADKSKKAPVNCINQMFKIVDVNGRKSATRTPAAASLVGTDPVVVPFCVDDICDRIMAGGTTDARELMGEADFSGWIGKMAADYCNNEREWSECVPRCFNCPFRCKEGDDNLRDGFKECWKHSFEGLTDEDFKRPWISDLNGSKVGYWKDGLMFLDDIVVTPGTFIDDSEGLISQDRNLLLAGMLTGRKDILQLFAHNLHGDTYLNIDALKREMDSWVYPLHMIDFETSAVALPFYKGMHPYESVAFQYSHHIIRKTAVGYSIEHAGQFINVEKGHFPNFDFLRALKAELDKDNGSIFRYAAHENTILRHIAKQLEESSEPDKDELIAFIESITEDSRAGRYGERNMIDLLEIVKRFYLHPSMKGSNSIKAVLPAVLNSSKFIQDKYSKRIYGSEIKSLTIPADDPIAWITFAPDGKTVINPYKLLPPISTYLDLDEATIDAIDEAASTRNIANGGAALTAYSELQFSDDVKSDALAKALLRYCELDTMAMVFIWEYFNNEV